MADEMIRWNKSLPEAFDVAAAPLEPSTTLYDWASRFLMVPVKRIFQLQEFAPGVRMGGFLTGLRIALADMQTVDVRNISGASESPPKYEVVRLNSQKADTFLIDGTAFLRSGDWSLVVNYEPSWSGMIATFFCAAEHRDRAIAAVDAALAWSRANNFLKGEAFALSGEFLDRTGETWEDLFLEPINEVPLKRTLKRFNDTGADFEPHGTLLAGPPGVGKTMSARAVLNTRQGSFIWVSARDFYLAGAFGGLAMAFEIAKEIAPSVIVFEDVDNWLDSWSVDYLKTEMDGVARSSGLWTMLTSNFPELLPEALIDRPGRFHDVLMFALPTPAVRRAMLAKWLPGLEAQTLEWAAGATDGMSGAHLFHLAKLALYTRDVDGVTLEEATRAAVQKTIEQRDLIGAMHRPQFQRRSVKALGRRQWVGRPAKSAEAASLDLLAALYAGKSPGWEAMQVLRGQLDAALAATT